MTSPSGRASGAGGSSGRASGAGGSSSRSNFTGGDVTAGMTARRKARKRALDVLYQADLRGQQRAVALSHYVARLEEPKPQYLPYTVTLVEGVEAHAERIDELLASYAEGWTLERPGSGLRSSPVSRAQAPFAIVRSAGQRTRKIERPPGNASRRRAPSSSCLDFITAPFPGRRSGRSVSI